VGGGQQQHCTVHNECCICSSIVTATATIAQHLQCRTFQKSNNQPAVIVVTAAKMWHPKRMIQQAAALARECNCSSREEAATRMTASRPASGNCSKRSTNHCSKQQRWQEQKKVVAAALARVSDCKKEAAINWQPATMC